MRIEGEDELQRGMKVAKASKNCNHAEEDD